jgi:hypothetical protein
VLVNRQVELGIKQPGTLSVRAASVPVVIAWIVLFLLLSEVVRLSLLVVLYLFQLLHRQHPAITD